MTDFFETTNDQPANVVDFLGAKRKRYEAEERRLERLVIERWTGKEEENESE